MRKGTPFFPLGFYVSEGSISSATLKGYLTKIADAGFNTMHAKEVEGYADFLDEAARRGVEVITENASENVLSGTLDRFKDNPALFGWNVRDDADDGAESFASIQTREARVRAADPNHVTYTALTGWNSQRRANAPMYAALAQLVGFEIYPITPPGYDVSPENALTETYVRTVDYVQAAKANRHALIQNAQTFNWGRSAGARYPSRQETRNMFYAALAAGVKGLLGYEYHGLEAQADLWAEHSLLAAEITAMSPVLLDGAMTRIDTGDREVVATFWVINDVAYSVVINTSYSATKHVSIRLPSGVGGTASPVFGGRPRGLIVRTGSLEGEILPVDVHVYRFGIAGAPLADGGGTSSADAAVATEDHFAMTDASGGDDAGTVLPMRGIDGARGGSTSVRDDSSGGCSCRVPRSSPTRSPQVGGLAFAVLALLGIRRYRRTEAGPR